jgi:glycosyltransferase involved in cell wall biosynthesis
MAKLQKHLLPGNIPSLFPPHTLSICMIVKNEEESLSGCLDSIKGIAEEIVIVDTGSTDRTVEIARSHGAKVIASDWRDDFSYSRNISLDHATSEWILWLDADDRVEEPSRKQLLRLKNEINNPVTLFGFKVKNLNKQGMGDIFMQVRMFPNDKRLRFEWPIHEQIVLSGSKCGYKVIYLNEIEILHSGYHDETLRRKKALRNRAIIEKGLEKYGGYPSYAAAYGDTYFMAEEWEKGIEAYKSVLDIPDCRKKHSDIYEFMFVTVALGYMHLKKTKEALEWVDKGLKNTPDKLELLFLGGDTSWDAGDFDRAFGYYKRAAEAPERFSTTPVDPVALKSKALMRQGKIHQRRREFTEAKQCFFKIRQMNANFFDTPIALGEVYLEEGNLIEALKSFSDAVLRFPGADPLPYRALGEICIRVGRGDEAENFYDKGLSFFPDDIPLLDGLKKYYRDKGETEKYLELGRRAVEARTRQGKVA